MNNLLVINRVRFGLKQIAGIVTHKIHVGYYNQVVNSNNKKIILFPTKTTWRKPSDIRLIIRNLILFKENYAKHAIESCAFPLIGCGLGGLNPNDVIPIMIEHLIDLDINCEVYVPEK